MTLEGFCELTQCPSRALNFISYMVCGTSDIKDAVRFVTLGVEVPIPHEANLYVCEPHFLKTQHKGTELVTRPDLNQASRGWSQG